MNTIAIDLDDTLNDFSRTLRESAFSFAPSYGLSEAVFDDYLSRIRSDTPDTSDLLSTEFSYFKAKIHQRCYELARPRADGVEFIHWLKAGGWRVVLCTHRDLRRSHQVTRSWLDRHAIPYDYLFMAANKLEFCWQWGIEFLVDDHPFYAAFGQRFAVHVFYPIQQSHPTLPRGNARGFHHFEELKQWLPKSI